MHDLSALINRVKKNQRILGAWARQHNFDCYRLYERDIPELTFIIDRYGDHAVIYDLFDDYSPTKPPAQADTIAALAAALGLGADHIHYKERRRMAVTDQYARLASSEERLALNEGNRKYLINLKDYLDTGLFLDHRPLREEFQTKDMGKFLNLFCYTGSVSVAAALGGAKTTSVDMSKNYVDWAEDNFQINAIDRSGHAFIRDDVIKFLKTPGNMQSSFDTIFLDPPTFSSSKKMDGTFDVSRDHDQLIDQCMQFLKPTGTLYFSCNFSKFRLNDRINKRYAVEDISEATIPKDFRNRKIHVCYTIKANR